MLNSYGLTNIPTTVKNPQANYVEWVHQNLGNMFQTKELEQHEFDYNDPWTQFYQKWHGEFDQQLAQ